MSSHVLATPHAPAQHGITISCCRQLHNWCSSLVAHGFFEPMCHRTLACSCARCETAKVLCHRWTSPSRKVPENLCKTFGKPEADHFFGWFPAHMPDASSRPSVRQQTLNKLPLRPCMHWLQNVVQACLSNAMENCFCTHVCFYTH